MVTAISYLEVQGYGLWVDPFYVVVFFCLFNCGFGILEKSDWGCCIGSIVPSTFTFTIFSKALLSYVFILVLDPQHFLIVVVLFLVSQHQMTLKSPTDRGIECTNHPGHLIGLWADPSLVTHSLRDLFPLLVGPRYFSFYPFHLLARFHKKKGVKKKVCSLLLNFFTVNF